MAQFQPAAQITTESVVNSILSALRVGAQQGGINEEMFASFLAETKPAMPEIDVTRSERVAQKPSAAPVGEDKRESGCDAKPVQDNEPSVQKDPPAARSEPAEEAPVAAEAPEQKEVDESPELKEANAAPVEEGTEEEKESKVAYSVLSPNFLDDLKKKLDLVLEGGGQEEEISAAVTALVDSKLKTLLQDPKEEGGEEETLCSAVQTLVGDSLGNVKKVIEEALKVKAGVRAEGEQLSASPDKTLLTASGKDEALLAQATKGAAQAEEETGLVLGKTGEKVSTLAFTRDLGAEGARETKSAGFEDVLLPRKSHGEGAPQSQSAAAVLAAAVQAQTATVSTAASTASAGVQAISVGEAGSTNLLGEGLRSSGSYDFAAQLSAARTAKGGTAGLQNPAEQIAVQINKMAKDGKEEMTINLRPPELGKVQVKLAFSSDGRVQVMVTADNQNALDLLAKDQSSLHKALQDAGLQTDSSSLEFSLNEGSHNGTFAQNKAQRNSENTEFSRITLEEDLLDDETETYYLTPGRVNLRV